MDKVNINIYDDNKARINNADNSTQEYIILMNEELNNKILILNTELDEKNNEISILECDQDKNEKSITYMRGMLKNLV